MGEVFFFFSDIVLMNGISSCLQKLTCIQSESKSCHSFCRNVCSYSLWCFQVNQLTVSDWEIIPTLVCIANCIAIMIWTLLFWCGAVALPWVVGAEKTHDLFSISIFPKFEQWSNVCVVRYLFHNFCIFIFDYLWESWTEGKCFSGLLECSFLAGLRLNFIQCSLMEPMQMSIL